VANPLPQWLQEWLRKWLCQSNYRGGGISASVANKLVVEVAQQAPELQFWWQVSFAAAAENSGSEVP